MKHFLLSLLLFLPAMASADGKKVIDVSDGSNIEELLGADRLTIDTLAITGRLRHTDFAVLRSLLVDGELSVIDMSGCTVEDDSIPEQAFMMYSDPKLDSIALPRNLRAIGDMAFYYTAIREINLPTSVRNVDRGAFTKCINVTQVEIPEGVENIGGQCFAECHNLERVSFPSTIKSIGKAVFRACPYIREIRLAEGIKGIGEGVFQDLPLLEQMTIPQSVEHIGSWAFYYNVGLRSLALPAQLEAIQQYTFYECSRLCDVAWPTELRIIYECAFRNCGFTTLALPEKLETIANGAFSGNSELTRLVLPESLREIGNGAFASCGKLREVYSPRLTPPAVAFLSTNDDTDENNPLSMESPFRGIAADAVLYVPVGTKALYEATEYAKDFAEIRETTYFPTGIDKTEAAMGGCRATGGNGCIYISTADGTTEFSVYSADGRLVAKGTANGTCTVKAPAGLCIVSTPRGKAKVVVR